MSNEELRGRQSTNFFKMTRKNEEKIHQFRERLWEEVPTKSPEIHVEAPSTSSLVEETASSNTNLLTTQNHNEKNEQLFGHQVGWFER